MQMLTAEQTLHDICRWRPALASILEPIAPLFQKQEELSAHCATEFTQRHNSLPAYDTTRFSQGISILIDSDLPECAWAFDLCAEAFQQPLQAIPALAEKIVPLAQVFRHLSHPDQKRFFEAVTTSNPDLIVPIANEANVVPLELSLYASFVVSAILHGLVCASYQDPEAERPWDENNVWQQGYCPVCGSYPTLGWLDRGKVDERNTYLLPGGGRKHLHCGVCGANWRFLRLACPLCGIAKSKHIEILAEESNTHGESLDWCSECQSYCPTVDVRERIAMPNLDAQAPGMLHLELIAWEKNLKPLRSSFWNTFS